MNLADEIQKLSELHRSGALSETEFESAKARLLQQSVPPPMPPEMPPSQNVAPHSMYAAPQAALQPSQEQTEASTRQWAMILHLSQLAGFVVPLGGLIAPIVIWQMKKKELPGIDIHGIHAVNWIITEVILFVICIPLAFIIIGIPLAIVLAILGIVFPVIAGVKANNGEVWRYPMTFNIIKPQNPPESNWPGH